MAAIQELDQCSDGTETGQGSLNPLQVLIHRTKKFLQNSRKKNDMCDSLPMSNPLPTHFNYTTQYRAEIPPPDPEKYVCVCFPGMTYKKYLHHVDVNRAKDDPQLFLALQQKYYDWKPFWKRVLTLRTLARVEYFEVGGLTFQILR